LSVIASVAPRDGGTTNCVLALGRTLRKLGTQNLIETTDADGYRARLNYPLGLHDLGGALVCMHRFHAPRKLKASAGHAQHIWARTRTADVVHIHGLYLFSFVAAVLACWLRRVPYVIQPHGGLEPYHQRKSRLTKNVWDRVFGRPALKRAHAIVCASEFEAEHIKALGYRHTVVIPHGVERQAGPPSAEIRERIALWGEDCVVLFLGRLVAKKHPEVLVEAWSKRARCHCRLVFVGPDRRTAEDLAALSRQLGCNTSVDLLGELLGADKWAILERADLFALPSENESFGIAVPEALTAGTAVLVTAAVATSSDVRAACVGWVVTDFEVTTWTNALDRALADPQALHVMGESARTFAAQRYNWVEAAKKYRTLYAQARGGPT